MAPLSMMVAPVDNEQILQDQVQCLAINLVSKYLRSVVKSDKLAIKLEEKISSPMANLDSIGISQENISIEEILKKHWTKLDEGASSSPTIIPVIIYKYIQEFSSDKLAERFAKKASFSYTDACSNLTKKEQKLSLNRICRRFLKNYDSSCKSNTEATKEVAKKLSIDNTGFNQESDSDSPQTKKKKKNEASEEAGNNLTDVQNDLLSEEELRKAPKNNKPCFKCNQPGYFAKVSNNYDNHYLA